MGVRRLLARYRDPRQELGRVLQELRRLDQRAAPQRVLAGAHPVIQGLARHTRQIEVVGERRRLQPRVAVDLLDGGRHRVVQLPGLRRLQLAQQGLAQLVVGERW